MRAHEERGACQSPKNDVRFRTIALATKLPILPHCHPTATYSLPETTMSLLSDKKRVGPLLLVLAFATAPAVWAACTKGGAGPNGEPRGSLSKDECNELETEVSHAQALGPKALDCSTNEDCDLVQFDLCGYGGCPGPIAKTARPEFHRNVERVEATACPAWKGGGCLENAPPSMPSCAFRLVACENGHCEGRSP